VIDMSRGASFFELSSEVFGNPVAGAPDVLFRQHASLRTLCGLVSDDGKSNQENRRKP